MRNFAYTLHALKRTLDGPGADVLRNTAVLCTSDVAEGLDHSCTDYPILLAGQAGGTLTSGLHYRAPNGRNTSDVLMTCARALGTGLTSVGKDQGFSNTPITQLLA
jgi:hypothetical protein